MKTLGFLMLTLCASLLLFGAMPGAALAADAAAPAPALSAEPAHVVTDAEIQAGIDQQLHSEAADRQAIRDLLARPDVQRVAGSAGLDLARADAAIGVLSGPELQRLASQARDANSRLVGGGTMVMSWTMIIIMVVALVVLIAIL